MDFKDRWVVVTGGAGSLGSAVVQRLLERGARCRVPVLEAEVPAHLPFRDDPRVCFHPGVDLTDQAAVDAVYDAGEVPWASVHCAGGFAWAPIEASDGALLRHMLAMNLETAFLCCRAAIRQMREGGQGGRIVNVASRQSLEPRLGASTSAYTASKAGVAALTAALGEEVVSDGILINAVAPSILDTPANRAAMPNEDPTRWVHPGEAADAICFLISPLSRVARGGVLPIYGAS